MRLNLFSLVIAFFLVSCEGCDDDANPKTELEKLPSATQVGKQTFGCLVDGKAWITNSYSDTDAYYQEGILSITSCTDDTGCMHIYLYEPNLSLDEYQLPQENETPIAPDEGSLDEYETTKCLFVTASKYTGMVTITYLNQGTSNKWIISGTFEFEAYSSDCDKIVKITDGRFDLNYAP